MFKLEATGREGSDCTVPYRVIFDKEYTVEEFTYTVLSERPWEWGSIGVNDDSHILNNPLCRYLCEYNRGKLLTALPAGAMDKKVVSAVANGGWGCMWYLLTVEGDCDS